ncbi:amidohydrolase family protein [Phenylobacterium sp.]|jgi:predicted TIM-barrel fold metal-dependent hydrolase|uniref:amidohydrolase family protein n=1 Tax=Phenylobacterium sp. TaxID=1871053 RepID=UPI0037C88A94
MPYAPATRAIYDADSHIMELPDFLKKYADPAIRDQIPEVSYSASIVTDEEVAVIMNQGGRHSDEHRAAQIALGDQLIAKSKEIQGLGAFDAADRTIAMDMLGFAKQLVFATHSLRMPFSPSSKLEPHLRYGASRAHNRHMADFCKADKRLIGVAAIPLDAPDLAIAELDWVLEQGLGAVWVPHRAPLGHAPGHVDLEPFWARLAEARVPFVLHVGGAPLQIDKSWANNGRAAVKDWLGGGENVRTKDAALLHQLPETFISMMVLDGVLERHPNLTGAVVELGAGWVPEMLRRLDWVARTWGRTDANIQAQKRKPSEQIEAQLAFTPVPTENLGVMLDTSSPDLYLFSSDYPHIEGGRDPLGKFGGFLEDRSEAVKAKFFTENFLRVLPNAA